MGFKKPIFFQSEIDVAMSKVSESCEIFSTGIIHGKGYRLSADLRAEQSKKLEVRLHFSKGKIRKLQMACYTKRIDAKELIWDMVSPHYYQPIYSEDSCYWKSSLSLTLFRERKFQPAK